MAALRRLASFASSPLHLHQQSSTVSYVKLANRGFMYTGHSDRLVCQGCGVEFSGWLETDRDPTVEHRCPSPSSTADDLSLIRVYHEYDHRNSTIYATYIAACRRAAKSGVLPLAESRDIEPRDRLGHASTAPVRTRPGPDTRRKTTPTDDDVTADDHVTSYDPGVLTLRLSLSRRLTPTVHYFPSCSCYWWWHGTPVLPFWGSIYYVSPPCVCVESTQNRREFLGRRQQAPSSTS